MTLPKQTRVWVDDQPQDVWKQRVIIALESISAHLTALESIKPERPRVEIYTNSSGGRGLPEDAITPFPRSTDGGVIETRGASVDHEHTETDILKPERLSALEHPEAKSANSTGKDDGWIDENTKVWIHCPNGFIGEYPLFSLWTSPIHPTHIMPYHPGDPKPGPPVYKRGE